MLLKFVRSLFFIVRWLLIEVGIRWIVDAIRDVRHAVKAMRKR